MKENTSLSNQWKGNLWLGRIFIALVCTVFLLACGPFATMSSIKKPLFLWIFGGYILASILLLMEGLLIGNYKLSALLEKIRPKNLIQIAMLCYFGISLLSAAFSHYSREAFLGGTRFEGALTIGIYVLCFYFLSVFSHAERWMLYLFASSVAVFSLICLAQLMGYDPFSLYPEGYRYSDAYTAYSGAYLGTLGNVDLVSAFLCICVPVMGLSALKGRGKYRHILWIPTLLSLAVVLQMGVLAGFVGLCIGLTLSFPFVISMSKKGKLLYFSLLCGLTLSFIGFLYRFDVGQGFFHELHCLLHGQISDRFGTGRIYIWRSVWAKLLDKLLLGAGPDTLFYANIAPFRRYDGDLNVNIVSYIDVAHNEYLNILYHQGIFALIAYLTALAVAFWQWIRGKGSPITGILGAGLASYLIQSFFGISQFIVAPYFWVCLGLFTSSLQYTSIQTTKQRRTKL